MIRRETIKNTTFGSVDTGELRRFGEFAAHWWDPEGPMRPLHKMNPIRLAYIRDQICQATGREATKMRPLTGLGCLDVGCGPGLLSEPLTRMGAAVTGIDPTPEVIRAGADHAAQQGLKIDYRCTTVEELVQSGEGFDLVTALEVVEHVHNWQDFLTDLAMLVRPGGILVLSTLNRTPKAFAHAIVGAEYLLGWLPRGTHDWRKFRKPSELAAILRGSGMQIRDVRGARYAAAFDRFELCDDPGVNYFLVACR
ncbi:MAG: bifunctional 2-polyprenyl-6-hydroxyphenol methylase/3-demethylubiquinol 3-O-methyltransferase UbiG [Pseudomonadota bacterium]